MFKIFAFDSSGAVPTVEFFYKYRPTSGKATTEVPAKVKELGKTFSLDSYEVTILLDSKTNTALNYGDGTLEYRVTAKDKSGNVKEIVRTIFLDYGCVN
ncbi:MAG: hypothetical protein AAB571_10245 [Chloroflexota bacterium]